MKNRTPPIRLPSQDCKAHISRNIDGCQNTFFFIYSFRKLNPNPVMLCSILQFPLLSQTTAAAAHHGACPATAWSCVAAARCRARARCSTRGARWRASGTRARACPARRGTSRRMSRPRPTLCCSGMYMINQTVRTVGI